MIEERLNVDEVKDQIKKELILYKYPYDHRAKLLNSIILLLELYEDEQPSPYSTQ